MTASLPTASPPEPADASPAPKDGLEQALARGERALRDGYRREAARWFDRAWRISGGEAAIGLLLASVLDEPDRLRARRVLAEVLARHPERRDAQLDWAAACFRDGEHAASARALAAVLGRHAAPRAAKFRSFADAVARAAGAPGWVGADVEGRIRVRRLAGGASKIVVEHDGHAVTAMQARRTASYRLDVAPAAHSVRVTCDGQELLGSPIALRALRRVAGLVRADADGGISGCAWVAGDPDAAPLLTLASDSRTFSLRARGTLRENFPGAPPFARGFRVAPGRLGPAARVRVLDRDGGELLGSPVALFPTRAPVHGRQAGPPRHAPPRAPVDVVIPVHRGADDLAACLASLRRGLPAASRIVIVDDASDDPALLAVLAACDDAVVLRQDRNRGFPAAANAGLRFAAADSSGQKGGQRRDVLLLNPDTLLPPAAVRRLADAAYSAADIGSVTPLSNDGTIVACDLPALHGDTARPLGQAEVDRIDAWCAAANPGQRVTLPTGIGFCLFLRHDCLDDVGRLRDDVFAQGYGEENDWCQRAGDRGWRHVAEAGMFVAHAGGRSFGHGRALLMARNAPLLDRLHPRYKQAVRDFLRADPLRHCKRRVAAACWAEGRLPRGAAILVTHDLGGGTEQRIVRRCADLARQGLRPIVLRLGLLEGRRDAHACTVLAGHADAIPDRAADLRFELPTELAELCALLRDDRPHWLELHHCGGLPPDILGLAQGLGIPYDVAVHDYAMLCPRVTFCGADGRYCGEPADIGQCDSCVATAGSRLHEAIGVAELRARSARILNEARQVLVSCDDVARRLRRYVPGLAPVVTPWEPDSPRSPARPMTATVAAPRETRICVLGALGRDKGYDVLLQCAQDAAARDLKLSFAVVGHTIDDARLLATGRVFVTGRFAAEEAEDLVRDQDASLGFLPSVCPETWSFALSTLWRAGLPVLSFALGAPAERIGKAGRGWTMPLGAPAARVNAVLLDLAARPLPGAREAAGAPHAPVSHAPGSTGVAHVAAIGHASGRAAPAQEVRA